jgi:acyl CoA:acetate/3-ketoacid CoA transferase
MSTSQNHRYRTGCGGFIDITYVTKKVVFSAAFFQPRAENEIGNGRLKINKGSAL